ncbi:CHAD domain-containing protein [Nocardia thailandica]|uniref:CHAD domain-containing protein n=1 Tax=Nocardia thailandica TaxID=257275 RepID=UPI0002EF6F90|nr:CHAD domain-containing protein [Nocardia thailandica]
MSADTDTADRLTVATPPPSHLLLADYLDAQRAVLLAAPITADLADPATVHEPVVAARRARSALSAHRPVVRKQSEVRRLIEELRWFGISLGAAAELREQSARLHAAVDGLRPRYLRGPVRERLDTYFAARVQPAWAAATELLAAPRYHTMLEDLTAEEGLLRAGVVPGLDGVDQARVLGELLERVRRRMRAVQTGRDEDGIDAATHALRKAVRRTRFYLESVHDLAPTRSTAAVDGLRALQDLLGEHQDAAVAKHHLIQLTREAESAGESTFTYGLLLQREIDRAACCAQALPATYWQSLRAVRVMADVHDVHDG